MLITKPYKMEKQSAESYNKMLDSFDYVVVLMLENRSLDNLLGYLYPDGVPADAPLGKTFNGVVGKHLSNPIPAGTVNMPPDGATSIPVTPLNDGNSHSPLPDPGETYDHVNTQLFNYVNGHDTPPYNRPPGKLLTPSMEGFVNDYIYNFKTEQEPGKDPSYDDYKQIMECYTPEAVPVLSQLAMEFGVFDHWYCAVPSQTWCNRAFWHAGTSWGHVTNGGAFNHNSLLWAENSKGDNTLFNQIEESGIDSPINWKIYSQQPYIDLTTIIHVGSLLKYHAIPPPFSHFGGINDFLKDCQEGKLRAYSFVEPRFWAPHTDMHPSSLDKADIKHYGPDKNVGEVSLGDQLVWQVYDAVRNSPQADRTLLIITFDEHGGTYDHVPPPAATPPNFEGYTLEEDFDFTRLGVRVPTVMISSHIAKNTVVNTPMHHCSFMKTISQKWNRIVPGKFPPLTPRVADAPEFSEVFTSEALRAAKDWPVIEKPYINEGVWSADFSNEPLNPLAKSIVGGVAQLPHAMAAIKAGVPLPAAATINTIGEAKAFLSMIPGLRGEEPLNYMK